MQYRKEPIITGECYHIFTRSIAKYTIFNSHEDYSRMMEILNLFHFSNFDYRYPNFKKLTQLTQKSIIANLINDSDKSVDIIADCLMPTHIHLILKQLKENGISDYMSRVLNSYCRYFNVRHSRSGPLYEGRFKSVHIKTDEQLLHITRYIHLNSTSAGLTENPEDWEFSSYGEYIGVSNQGICNLDLLPNFSPKKYKQFTDDQKSYQKSLENIKHLLIDN